MGVPDADPRFDVLVVGTTNVCRSVAAERLLRARLGGDSGVTVGSAGTHAAGDAVPEPLRDLLDAAGAPSNHHVPRMLDPDLVTCAGLVLTTTRAERAEVVRLVPAAVRRTFTLREFARLCRTLEPSDLPVTGSLAERLAALTVAVVPRRVALPVKEVGQDDVAPPRAWHPNDLVEPLAEVEAAVVEIVRLVGTAAEPAAEVQEQRVGGEEGALVVGAEAEAPVPTAAVVGRSAAPGPGAVSEPGTLLERTRRAGQAPTSRRRRLRDVVLLVVAAVLALALLAGIVVAVLLNRLDARIERFADPFADLPDRPPVAEAADGQDRPVTVLVLGGTGAAGRPAPDARTTGARTSLVMLAGVSGDRERAHVVAMPPDLWVDVPGVGPATLRDAVASGGVPRAVHTVERLTAVRIDHVALTDAMTFAHVTEALGGVDLDVEPGGPVEEGTAAAGAQRLTGSEVLAWVEGDDDASGRAAREEAWLRAIVARLDDSDVRSDPGTWLDLLAVGTRSVAVDEGLDAATMRGLVTSLRKLRPADVEVVTAPTTTAPVPTEASSTDGEGEGAGAIEVPEGKVLVPDEEPFEQLMDAVRTDTVGDHLAEDP